MSRLKSVLVPLCCALSACFCAAESVVWDFVGGRDGLPAGEVRKGAKLAPEGLVSTAKNRRGSNGYLTDPGAAKSPAGAFRIAVDVVPAAPAKGLHRINYNMALFDTMGILRTRHGMKDGKFRGVRGIQLALIDLGNNRYIPVARFGCGNEIAVFHGETVTLPPGKPARIGLDYDALSCARITVDGRVVATATVRGLPKPGGAVRIGAAWITNSGFTGTVTRAELEYLPVPRCALAVSGARVLRQGSTDQVDLEFRSGDPADRYEKLEIAGDFAGIPFEKRAIQAEKSFRLPVETRLVRAAYPLKYTVTGKRNGEDFTFSGDLELKIVSAGDDGLPVRLWTESEDYAECRRYYQLGFTHVLFTLGSHLPAAEYSPIVVGAHFADLDNCAATGNGIRVMDYIDLTNYRLDLAAKYPIPDRNGKPRGGGKRAIPDATRPEVVATMRELAYASGKHYGAHPALYGILVNTERRDHTQPALDKRARERYFSATGRELPAEVDAKLPPSYLTLENFPASGIIPDDHPLLLYYRWFWKEGDGMNDLNGEMAAAFKAGAGNPDLVVMYDPAVRVPPVWGSGGNVDLLNQWVYAYPEPFRVAAVAGEQRAMAAGCPGQRAGIMTQMIVKRHELAPPGAKIKKPPKWVKWEPKASYMTTPPGLLREATWAMLSRHVDSIMYYGAGALLPPNFIFTGLKYIDPESQKALAEIFNGVVKPLGKMLRLLPEREADTAVYESFAACLFAGRGGWGWGREWPSGMLLFRANLAPKTLYDESILAGDLKNVKVLFMPHCDVLTASVAREIEEFQLRGGIVVADRNLAPGITPDLVVDEVRPVANANAFNKSYKRAAAGLLKKLHGFYTPFVSADPEFLTFPRKWKGTDYLFVVNDRRAYGPMFGAWRRVMEKGMPHKGSVLVRRKAGAVYELSRGGRIDFTKTPQGVKCELDFATNDGRILMFLDAPIASAALVTPRSAALGDKLKVRVEIRDGSGKAVPALLPVSFTLTSPDGKAETVYDCATDGMLEREFLIPLNAPPGEWKLVVRDRASGLKAQGKFTVKGR